MRAYCASRIKIAVEIDVIADDALDRAKISVSDQRSAGWFVPSRSVGTPARHGVNRDGSRAAVVVAADVAPLSSTNTNIRLSGCSGGVAGRPNPML